MLLATVVKWMLVELRPPPHATGATEVTGREPLWRDRADRSRGRRPGGARAARHRCRDMAGLVRPVISGAAAWAAPVFHSKARGREAWDGTPG